MYMTVSVQSERGVPLRTTTPLCKQQVIIVSMQRTEELITIKHSFICWALCCIFIHLHDNQLILPCLAIIKTTLQQTKMITISKGKHKQQ